MGLSGLVKKALRSTTDWLPPEDFKAPEGSGIGYLNHLVEKSSEHSRAKNKIIPNIRTLRESPDIRGVEGQLKELDEAIDAFYQEAVIQGFINPDFTPSKISQYPVWSKLSGLTPKDYETYVDLGVIRIYEGHSPKKARKG